MNKPNEDTTLNIKPRPSENVSISIPKDTLESLQEIASQQDMSLEALLKFYIGQGLRQDLAKLSSDERQEVKSVQSQQKLSELLLLPEIEENDSLFERNQDTGRDITW